jgi:phosphatidylglycerophosphatase C
VRSCAVFDLDGTLLDGDSTTHWLLERFKRSPLRLLVALVLLPAVLFVLLRSTRKLGASLFLWIATWGMSEADLHSSLSDFAQRVRAGGLRVAWRAGGLTILERHVQAGDRVVIATAAPAWLAEALFELRATHIAIVGSRLRKLAGGYVCDRHCYAAEKCRALSDAGYSSRWQYAYTDTLADRPLLERAEHGFVINPNARLLARVRAHKLGEPLRW